MSIKDWPEGERPREKLLTLGVDALSDAELLAVFLRSGVQGHSAVDVSRDLLKRFGGLRGLLGAERVELCEARGLGTAKYAQLQAVLELSRRHLAEPLRVSEPLSTSYETHAYLHARLRDSKQEQFLALWLDNQNRVLNCEVLARGTVNTAMIYPREVLRAALRHNAAAVVFAHNHPSGCSEPSRDDITLTKRLMRVLSDVDIAVLDHLVIGEDWTSLAKMGVV